MIWYGFDWFNGHLVNCGSGWGVDEYWWSAVGGMVMGLESGMAVCGWGRWSGG